MNAAWRPWRSLLHVWVPAVALCLASLWLYFWLSSESLGREGALRDEVAELEQKVSSLRTAQQDALGQQESLEKLQRELGQLQNDVFGSLDARLTNIMRAVGTATREAGLVPEAFTYSAGDVKTLGLVRFGIQFAVEGQYEQVRRMLVALQASPEFLIVDALTIDGENEATTTALRINVKLATYLASADRQRLQELIGQKAIREAGNE